MRCFVFLGNLLCLLILCVSAGAQQPATPEQPRTAGTEQKNVAPEGVPSQAPQETERAQEPPTGLDPREIVRRSVEIDHRNWEKAQSYTCQQHEVIKHLGKRGEVKSTEIKTFDINFYYGHEYSRLVQKDDKPLSEQEQKKEDEKLEKFLAKYRNESQHDREKRLAKEKKEREEGRAFLRDVVNAYDFRIAGEESVDGAETWVIEATPRKDFHPTQSHADMLAKIKGTLWIEKKGYNWVKAEAEATDTISFGLFLFRIHPGSRFKFEQVHLNNEVWLFRRLNINGSARVALLKNEAVDQEEVFSNFKKFSTAVRILPGVKEVPQENAPK
jgi:hypothetical protein